MNPTQDPNYIIFDHTRFKEFEPKQATDEWLSGEHWHRGLLGGETFESNVTYRRRKDRCTPAQLGETPKSERRWVKFTDKMPKVGTWIILGRRKIIWEVPVLVRKEDENGLWTHWMPAEPLPEPPKEPTTDELDREAAKSYCTGLRIFDATVENAFLAGCRHARANANKETVS
jgi:hypothetical protein